MITTMITGSIYPMISVRQSPQYEADANGYMTDVRKIQTTPAFGEALAERAEEVRIKGTDFVADVAEISTFDEPQKGRIVDEYA